MSAVIEKTLTALPSILSAVVTGRPELIKEGRSTSAVQEFMRNCKHLSSNLEEERFITKEIEKLRLKITCADSGASRTKNKIIRDCLVCLLYCHFLGYDVSFAYIYAVKLTTQGSALEQRSAYLMCSMFLDEHSEMAMLLINSLSRIIRRVNVLDKCNCLTIIPYILSADMVPTLLDAVLDTLNHKKEIVRKKIVLCLIAFHKKAPDFMTDYLHLITKALCDESPAVAWVAICFFLDEAKGNPAKFKDLTGSFVNILRQIVEHKLPAVYNYQGIPAPWMSISLLQLLALLGKQDQQTSALIHPILKEVLHRTDATTKTGLAVIYECVMTIAAVCPNSELLGSAAKCIAKFLSSANNSFRYLGLKALSELVRVSPRFALDHQAVVMECLQHDDPTLQNQAYELLYGMANPKNLKVVSGKLLERLAHLEDEHLKKNLVTKLLELCKRFEDQFDWYLRTMNEILLHADAGSVPQAAVNRQLEVILSAAADKQLAVNCYWTVLHSTSVPDQLLQVALLTVSEYWQKLPDQSAQLVVDTILTWLAKSTSRSTQRSAVLALQRVLPFINTDQQQLYSKSIQQVIERANIKDPQILRELQGVFYKNSLSQPMEGNVAGLEEIDFTFSFLDAYVLRALENGAPIYKPPHLRPQMKSNGFALFCKGKKDSSSGLRYEAYGSSSVVSLNQSQGSFKEEESREPVELNVKKNVWGRAGYHPDHQTEADLTKKAVEDETCIEENDKESDKTSELAGALFQGLDDDSHEHSDLNFDLTEHDINHGNSIKQDFGLDLDSEEYVTAQFLDDYDDLDSNMRNMGVSGPGGHYDKTSAHGLIQKSPSKGDDFHKHRYASLLDDHFEVDSLDGSPEKELPPARGIMDKNKKPTTK